MVKFFVRNLTIALLLLSIVASYRPHLFTRRSLKCINNSFRHQSLHMVSTTESTGLIYLVFSTLYSMKLAYDTKMEFVAAGSVSSRILNALQKKYPPGEIFRVIDCFSRFVQVIRTHKYNLNWVISSGMNVCILYMHGWLHACMYEWLNHFR